MTRDCRSIGTNNGEVSGLREKGYIQNLRHEFNSRLTYSLFCVHLSNHKFGDGVRDARTTKLPRRESAALAARIADKSVSAQMRAISDANEKARECRANLRFR